MKLWRWFLNLKLVRLISSTISEFGTDNGGLLAASVSYYLLFSLFPFALAAISLAGFIMESPGTEEKIIAALGTFIPVARDLIASTLNGVVTARTTTGILALLGFVWSASSFFNALRTSLNAVWGLKDHSFFLKGRLIALSLTIGAFILLIIYIWLSTGVRLAYMTGLQWENFSFINATAASKITINFVSWLLAFTVILLLYKFIPVTRPRWKDIWAGALCAGAGFELVRVVFVWYVKNFATYNLVYGPVGTVIALLVFIYLTAWVLLFFAKLCAVISRSSVRVPC